MRLPYPWVSSVQTQRKFKGGRLGEAGVPPLPITRALTQTKKNQAAMEGPEVRDCRPDRYKPRQCNVNEEPGVTCAPEGESPELPPPQ